MVAEINSLSDVGFSMDKFLSESTSFHSNEHYFSRHVKWNGSITTYSTKKITLGNSLLEKDFRAYTKNKVALGSFKLEIYIRKILLDTFFPITS